MREKGEKYVHNKKKYKKCEIKSERQNNIFFSTNSKTIDLWTKTVYEKIFIRKPVSREKFLKGQKSETNILSIKYFIKSSQNIFKKS